MIEIWILRFLWAANIEASTRAARWRSHLQAATIIERYLWALGHRTTTVEALKDNSRWS
jgi:hypothetical protein